VEITRRRPTVRSSYPSFLFCSPFLFLLPSRRNKFHHLTSRLAASPSTQRVSSTRLRLTLSLPFPHLEPAEIATLCTSNSALISSAASPSGSATASLATAASSAASSVASTASAASASASASADAGSGASMKAWSGVAAVAAVGAAVMGL
jgi:hypothetical protein